MKKAIKKIIKVFHPNWDKSIYCKKALKKYPGYELQVHSSIDNFDFEFEKKQLLETTDLVILFPLWTYGPPYTYKYWVDNLDFKAELAHVNLWIHTTVGGPKEWYQRTEPVGPREFLLPIERTWAQIMRANVLGIRVDYIKQEKRIGK